MGDSKDLPHLLFYGPEGVGKKTRITALLRQIYGSSTEKLKLDQRTFETPSRTVEIAIVSSNYHVELNPSDAGIYDRIVVQDLIKEIAQTQQVTVNSPKKFKGNIIPPLQSRCLLIRVPAPSHPEISELLLNIAQKEKIKLQPELALRIAEQSMRNVRKAVLMLESLYIQKYPFNDPENIEIPLTDWEAVIFSLGQSMLKAQSPQTIMQCRTVLYELLSHCIPPNLILRTLAFHLIERIDESLKAEVIAMASLYVSLYPIFGIVANHNFSY
ncbi:Replication factor C subunit 5 [Zancudomyces culisetae]|uniref:Replication factor C subunit 5 n=1 Tax=Zancudomyces culisetae TaxID=1213189 RepID=A0A1R1PHD1_ZANCU|nr:Replication factor C subunit 5 [Zancudomyces culisetae]|eukprot:OMH80347.1 Replication factor C subunit 5 [Zancudomyces culisetae]